MLRLLGKLGKGLATKIGIGALVGGGAATVAAPAVGAAFALDPSVIQAIQELTKLIMAIGTLLAGFGIGRKAGYAVPDGEKPR